MYYDSRDVMRQNPLKSLTEGDKLAIDRIKEGGLEFHGLLEELGQSRELSLAKTKIEEAVMWAVKHITK